MGTLRTELTQVALDAAIQTRLANGQKVLLVGAAPSNVGALLAKHPQVMLWDSDSPALRRHEVPAGAGIVLFTKFIRHTDHYKIIEVAKRDEARFVHPELLGTGEIKRLLRPLQESSPVNETPTAVPVELCDVCRHPLGNVVGSGQNIREFAASHWRYDDTGFGWQRAEAERLHRLAGRHGITTTVSYLQSLVSELNADRATTPTRDEARLTEERAELAAQARAAAQMSEAEAAAFYAAVNKPKVVEPPAVETPPVTPQATSEARVDAGLEELVRMLRAADSALGDSRAVIALAIEQVETLARQNAELRSVREALRKKVLTLAESL